MRRGGLTAALVESRGAAAAAHAVHPGRHAARLPHRLPQRAHPPLPQRLRPKGHVVDAADGGDRDEVQRLRRGVVARRHRPGRNRPGRNRPGRHRRLDGVDAYDPRQREGEARLAPAAALDEVGGPVCDARTRTSRGRGHDVDVDMHGACAHAHAHVHVHVCTCTCTCDMCMCMGM